MANVELIERDEVMYALDEDGIADIIRQCAPWDFEGGWEMAKEISKTLKSYINMIATALDEDIIDDLKEKNANEDGFEVIKSYVNGEL